MTGSFKVTLTDFGLATTKRYPTDYGSGSISYTSPESLQGPPAPSDQVHGSLLRLGQQKYPYEVIGYDAVAADVWSLGVILFNLLTGKNPWHAAQNDDEAYLEYITWRQQRKNHLQEHFSTFKQDDKFEKMLPSSVFIQEEDELFLDSDLSNSNSLFENDNLNDKHDVSDLSPLAVSFNLTSAVDSLFISIFEPNPECKCGFLYLFLFLTEFTILI